MGGCIVSLEGETKVEVREKLERTLKELEQVGLYEEWRTEIEWLPEAAKFVFVMRVHT